MNPHEALKLLNQVQKEESIQHKLQAMETCQGILEKDMSSSLVLLPGVLSLLSDPTLILRVKLIGLLKKILITAANFEPNTCRAVFTASLEGLAYLSADEEFQVVKEFIVCNSLVYPTLFRFLCRYPGDARCWSLFSVMKAKIQTLVFHSNDGVKIAAIKFLQMMAIVQSPKDSSIQERLYPSLDDIPLHHPYLKSSDLRGEGVAAFNKIMLMLSSRVKAGVMTASINSLLVICQNRVEYLDFTIKTLIQFRSDPPAHLSNLERKSVERAIKIFMLTMLRCPYAENFLELIVGYLTEVGVRSFEIQMRIQQKSSSNKRAFTSSDWEEESKRIKTEQDRQLAELFLKTVDISKLPAPLVIEIVLQTLVSVTPINWDNGVTFFKQMFGLAPVISGPIFPSAPSPVSASSNALTATGPSSSSNKDQTLEQQDQLVTLKPGQGQTQDQTQVDPESLVQPPRQLSVMERNQVFQEILFRFFESEHRFSGHSTLSSVSQVSLTSDINSLAAAKSGWMLLISRLVSRTNISTESESESYQTVHEAKESLVNFILDDFKKRMELAIYWLHEEYYKELLEIPISPTDTYPVWFHKLLYGLLDHTNPQGEPALDPHDRAFTRFLIEVPELTPESLQGIVKTYCEQEERMPLGLSTLRDLILYRPAVREECLEILLPLTLYKDDSTRTNAILTCKKFYKEHSSIGPFMKDYSLQSLYSLLDFPFSASEPDPVSDSIHSPVTTNSTEQLGLGEQPSTIPSSQPNETIQPSNIAMEITESSSQDIKRHLEFYLALCSKDANLLDELFTLFPKASVAVQNVILQDIVGLVKALESQPSKLVDLIKEFPPSTDSLVLKIISVLSKKEPLLPELVDAVKWIYYNKKLGAEFLIPVLEGLDKQDILEELPRVIELLDGTQENRDLVQSVFVKLITSKTIGGEDTAEETIQPCILSPVDLMVTLHTMEDSVGVKKSVEATSICFSLDSIYNQEALVAILQQLVELPVLPTLLMRTVIQSVTLYQDLTGFVNSILTLLITKQVWKNSKLWDGFVRCCTMLFPSSLPIVYALPKPQAQELITKSPKLKEALRVLMESLPPHQKTRREFQSLLPLVQ